MLNEKCQAELILSIFWILTLTPPDLHTKLSYVLPTHDCCGQVNRKPLFPQFSSQPPNTTRPRPWSYCQHHHHPLTATTSLHWKYGRHMVRQELQELREKQNLAAVLVPVAVSQGSLWPRRTWRNGKHLKGVMCFLSGGRVFLTIAKVIYLSTKGWDFLI